jgi:SAM-dependent methyltransferase
MAHRSRSAPTPGMMLYIAEACHLDGTAPMKDYYEDLWERLPFELTLPDWELRRGFLARELRPGDRVLDLGSGAGAFTAEIARHGYEVIGAEVAQAAIDRAREQHPALDFRLVPFDGPLPFEDNAFDLVWASEVIEHVADTARWLSEVRRVLTTGGRLLLTTPSHGRLLLLLHGIEPYCDPLGDHLHLYTRGALEALLREFGFTEITVRSAGGPPLLRRRLLGRARR